MPSLCASIAFVNSSHNSQALIELVSVASSCVIVRQERNDPAVVIEWLIVLIGMRADYFRSRCSSGSANMCLRTIALATSW